MECINFHKKQLNCSGKRSKTDYISRSDFNINHLYSDYNFLYEIEEKVNFLKRQSEKPIGLNIAKEARKRSINLKLMPKGMQKSKNNKTHIKNKEMYWTIELKVSNSNQTIFILKNEHMLLKDIIQEIQTELKLAGQFTVTFNDTLVDIEKSLGETLKGHTIIEYPTFIAKEIIQLEIKDEAAVANADEFFP